MGPLKIRQGSTRRRGVHRSGDGTRLLEIEQFHLRHRLTEIAKCRGVEQLLAPIGPPEARLGGPGFVVGDAQSRIDDRNAIDMAGEGQPRKIRAYGALEAVPGHVDLRWLLRRKVSDHRGRGVVTHLGLIDALALHESKLLQQRIGEIGIGTLWHALVRCVCEQTLQGGVHCATHDERGGRRCLPALNALPPVAQWTAEELLDGRRGPGAVGRGRAGDSHDDGCP